MRVGTVQSIGNLWYIFYFMKSSIVSACSQRCYVFSLFVQLWPISSSFFVFCEVQVFFSLSFHLGSTELLTSRDVIFIEPLQAISDSRVSAFLILYCFYNAFGSLYSLLRYLILLVILSSFKCLRQLSSLEKPLASRGVKHHFKTF